MSKRATVYEVGFDGGTLLRTSAWGGNYIFFIIYVPWIYKTQTVTTKFYSETLSSMACEELVCLIFAWPAAIIVVTKMIRSLYLWEIIRSHYLFQRDGWEELIA